MFETHDIAEVPIHSLIADDGARLWQYVALRIHIPWFHVVYTETEAETSGMIFLSNTEQLLDLQQQIGIKIKQVDLVSPGYINGSTNWKMEPLKEIWEGLELGLSNEQKLLLYVLNNGNRYVNSAVGSTESDLTNRQLVFKA